MTYDIFFLFLAPSAPPSFSPMTRTQTCLKSNMWTLTRERVPYLRHPHQHAMAPNTKSVFLLPGGSGSQDPCSPFAVSSVMRITGTMPFGAHSAATRPAAAYVSGDTCAASTTLAAPCAAMGTPKVKTPWEPTNDVLPSYIVGGVVVW